MGWFNGSLWDCENLGCIASAFLLGKDEKRCGFNPLTPMDLIPWPFEEKVSLDGEKKAKMVRQLHEEVQLQIEKKKQTLLL
jgi:hypothetical protein